MENLKNGEPVKFKYFGTIGRIAAIVFAGFSIYLFFSTVMLILLTKSSKEIIVPDVVNKPFIDMYGSISRAGLVPELKFREVYDMDSGIILKQYPDPGEVVSENTNLHLVVSRNIFMIEVPSVVGDELPIAINKLKSLNYRGRPIVLDTGVITYMPSETVSDNTVLDQIPGPGERISPDRKINLLVSAGKIETDQTVPLMVNQSIDLCYELLASKGYSVIQEVIETYNRSKSGLIASQKPSAGTILPRGRAIRLKVYWYPMRDHPFRCYEKVEFVVPDDTPKGLFEVFVEDYRSKRIAFSRTMGPGEKILFVFRREGNAKLTITRNKKPLRVMGINVDE